MEFNTKSRNSRKLAEPGEYDFTIVEADERDSSNGNRMIEVTLEVECGEDRIKVKDYLLAKRPKQLQKAAEACGLGRKFETGRLSDSDFRGCFGRVKIGISHDKQGEYPDKNVVKEYVVEVKAPAKREMLRLSSGASSIDEILRKYSR